jgi:molecular chaperone DnaK
VITVPACASAVVRQAVAEAAELAGLLPEWNLTDPRTGRSGRRPMRLLAKPTAAALGFGLTTAWTRDRRVAVLHAGGGGFEVSLLEIGDGVFHVRGVAGASDLGGDSLDVLLASELADEVKKQDGVDARGDPVAWSRLLLAVEQARRDLSTGTRAEILLPCFAGTGEGAFTLRTTLTRQRLERLGKPFLDRCREVITRALADARWQTGQVAEVALTGGLARMPLFGAMVRGVFGAVRCRTQPPEIVAAGAAIQGHQLQLGSQSDVLLVDVASLSLGVELPDGKVQRLLERGTGIPAVRGQRVALPVRDGEARARFFQGESDRSSGNTFLGEACLAQVREEPRGQAGVEVSCAVDVSGAVEVTLKDVHSGRSQTSPLWVSTGLGAAEVARLVREAEQERLFRGWAPGVHGG